MQQFPTRAVTALLLALLITSPVAAQTAKLAKCQTVNDRIERYTGLRRKGGSTSQMQQWKEQLRANEDQFYRMDCKNYRRKLR
jgi:hypothetical protein